MRVVKKKTVVEYFAKHPDATAHKFDGTGHWWCL